jgi:hypothetical protein
MFTHRERWRERERERERERGRENAEYSSSLAGLYVEVELFPIKIKQSC